MFKSSSDFERAVDALEDRISHAIARFWHPSIRTLESINGDGFNYDPYILRKRLYILNNNATVDRVLHPHARYYHVGTDMEPEFITLLTTNPNPPDDAEGIDRYTPKRVYCDLPVLHLIGANWSGFGGFDAKVGYNPGTVTNCSQEMAVRYVTSVINRMAAVLRGKVVPLK